MNSITGSKKICNDQELLDGKMHYLQCMRAVQEISRNDDEKFRLALNYIQRNTRSILYYSYVRYVYIDLHAANI